MAEPRITRETLRALARLSGLELDDDRLEEILPQVQVNADAIAHLDELDLENVEPAVTFQAGTE